MCFSSLVLKSHTDILSFSLSFKKYPTFKSWACLLKNPCQQSTNAKNITKLKNNHWLIVIKVGFSINCQTDFRSNLPALRSTKIHYVDERATENYCADEWGRSFKPCITSISHCSYIYLHTFKWRKEITLAQGLFYSDLNHVESTASDFSWAHILAGGEIG